MRIRLLSAAMATLSLLLSPLSTQAYTYDNGYSDYYTSHAQSVDDNYHYGYDGYDTRNYYREAREDRRHGYRHEYSDDARLASSKKYNKHAKRRHYNDDDDGGRGGMPSRIAAHGEKVIIVDPSIHEWGAYSSDGTLLKSGTATAGASYCRDTGRRCRTSVGTFRIQSLGSRGCKSSRYPVGRGGAPMPYCMYFNRNMALHGSNQVVRGNVSHGCVRLHVGDAEWIRYNFANVGTKVVIKPY